MDRPIVVNSLLCFIHNYRHSLLPEQLKALLHNYFSKSARSMARATLTELLPSISLPEMATATYPADTTDPDDHVDNDSDLLYLYDRITGSEQSPVFVAADLNILPLQLITDKDDSKSELLREIRQLKRFIQDALNGRVDEPSINQADSGVQTICERQPDCDFHDQSSSGYCLTSPKSSFKSATNASTSSPELPASTSSISSTPCSSLIPTTMASPASPYPENNQSIIGLNNSMLDSTLALNDNGSLSNGGSNQDSTTTTIASTTNNYNRRKRDGSGNRLDAMIRKLASRQKEKEAAAAAILANGSSGISMCSGLITSTISSSSCSSSSSSSLLLPLSSSSLSSSITITTTTASLVVPPEQLTPPAKAIWHTQMIDPVAYVSMLRTMSGAAAAAAAVTAISSPSSIFPSINKTMQNDHRSKNDSVTEFGDSLEDGSIELAEKNSNESSPSPSDSSNNVDDTMYTAADLAEKPFTCEHTSCHKRFANKFLLKKHQFIHTGLRPHCCPFCGKRFNRKDNLLRHKKTHIANALKHLIEGYGHNKRIKQR
uniref:Hypothetical zinc finger protein B0310.2 in chromosome X, putative n=1 Tax=Brugia malayi TaxID=6279 RepID=A0A7I4K379_BRUMA